MSEVWNGTFRSMTIQVKEERSLTKQTQEVELLRTWRGGREAFLTASCTKLEKEFSSTTVAWPQALTTLFSMLIPCPCTQQCPNVNSPAPQERKRLLIPKYFSFKFNTSILIIHLSLYRNIRKLWNFWGSICNSNLDSSRTCLYTEHGKSTLIVGIQLFSCISALNSLPCVLWKTMLLSLHGSPDSELQVLIHLLATMRKLSSNSEESFLQEYSAAKYLRNMTIFAVCFLKDI